MDKLNFPSKENTVQLKINEIIDELDNFVTTNTAQNITQPKTFIGQKLVLFKQATSTNKLGFTLYNNSGTEKGYLEYNPSNTVDSVPLMTLGNYATASAGLTHVGFRKYSSVSGASGAYNLLAPLISDAKTPFGLTTTYTNFYLPLGFTDGNTTVLTAKTGLVDISSLLPTVPTVNNATITFTQGGTTKGTITLNQANNDTIALDAGGGGGASALTDLSDVSITSASSGDVLSFDGSDWINTSGFIKNIATGSGAISFGSNAVAGTANQSINIGAVSEATKNQSIAIGGNAKATAVGAIQIGVGTNSTACSLNIGGYKTGAVQYNWQLLDGQTGLIPDARLSSNIARNADIDGNWTASGKQVLNNAGLNGSTDLTFDLSTYLPNTTDLYEILVTANCKTGTTAGNSIAVIASIGGYPIDLYLCSARTTANGEAHGSGSCIITAKRTDTFKIKRSSSYNGSCNVWFAKYKKVR